ncbi:MAG: hypothetical protein ABFS30_15385, partial [Pseudomonadota bacterium]
MPRIVGLHEKLVSCFALAVIDLEFRKQFNLNVIGLVEKEGEDGLPHVRLGSAATIVLEVDDILVVLGRDEYLDAL